ncbi:MAG: pilin [Patescibacteria group bacterium]|nr:pilin [Patescibacteria group bacterium]
MKKISLLSTVLLVVPVVALAQGFVPLAPITGLTDASALSVANSTNLASFFNNLYKFSIGIAAALAVIQIIWAGLDIAIFHKDAVSAITDDKGKIYNAVFGLILVLSPVLVFSIINPSILNLSLNLPPLKTTSGTPVGTGNGAQTPSVTDAATGCTVTGTLLKKASCPTQQKAQDFAASCPTGSGSVLSCQTENSSGCADTTYYATCDTSTGSITGPFVFLDISHYLNPMQLFSNYVPLATSASNPNNGVDAVRFANTCTQDGGITCVAGNGVTGGLVSATCTYTTVQPASQSNKCYTATLSCRPSSWATTLNIGGGASWLYVCSGSPSWTSIQ